MVADAVGCHHGERATPTTLNELTHDRRVQERSWIQARRTLFIALLDFFRPINVPVKLALSGPDFMLLSGLTSFADWIGSDETHFTFGQVDECADIPAWWASRQPIAEASLDAIGWLQRAPLLQTERTFQEVFGFSPRPLQQKVAEALAAVDGPCVLLLEAPMGEGKTEAAFYAHLELQRRFGHRGLYIALPTKATGNAMFGRTLEFLKTFSPDRNLDFQLLHGGTALNDSYQELKRATIHDPEGEGRVRVGEWFTHRKRALLSEYGVGTVDQALLPILPVRHQFVRLWGLANRVVVFDEIHAYDAYTGTLLIHLIQWLVALGASVVLLSATLPPRIRAKIVGSLGKAMPDEQAPYPRLTVIQPSGIQQMGFEADPLRRQQVEVEPLSSDLSAIRSALDSQLPEAGCALALVNTVQRAQDLYSLYSEGIPLMRGRHQVGKQLEDGTEILLFHARFPADIRQAREDNALASFGKKSFREGRRILIATQVAEQSLDLDFDFMVTDLAPIDLLLQRAGRLWRHDRGGRPLPRPRLLVAGLDGIEPSSFGAPLWWGAVYREDLLLRTWLLLKEHPQMTLPDDIDGFVQAVYEEEVTVPEALQERLAKAIEKEDGASYAHTGKAHGAIIGDPDNDSWNDPARFTQADEDEPGLHPSLRALTRLGDPSVMVVPILADEIFDPAQAPSSAQAKAWSLRALSISQKAAVAECQTQGVPDGWSRSPLLRHSYALRLDNEGRWQESKKVRLDPALGLVFERKE